MFRAASVAEWSCERPPPSVRPGSLPIITDGDTPIAVSHTSAT